MEDLPGIVGGPTPVGEPELLIEAGNLKAYCLEMEMLWRWDLFKDEEHFHTGCALSKDSALRAAQGKIKLYGTNEQLAMLVMKSRESSED